MKLKKLIILILILASLLTLTLAKKKIIQPQQKKAATLESALNEIGPDAGLDLTSRIEIDYQSSDPRQISLLKNSDNTWKMEKPYAVGARKDAVEALIKISRNLKGEIRSEGEQFFEDYSLTDAQAIRLKFLDKENNELRHILLSHLRPRGTQNFLRLNGSEKVFVTDTDFLAQLGIFSKEDKLNANSFYDLRLAGIDSSKVVSAELTNPKTQTLLLEKKEDKDKKKTWVLNNNTSDTLDEAKVNELLANIYNLYASVPAADDTQEFVSKAPWLKVVSNLDGKMETVEIYLGQTLTDKKMVRVKVTPENYVYEVPQSQIDLILKKDKPFFMKSKNG